MEPLRYVALFFLTSHIVWCGVAAGKTRGNTNVAQSTSARLANTGQGDDTKTFPYDTFGQEVLPTNVKLYGKANLRIIHMSRKDRPGQPIKSVTLEVAGRTPVRVNYFQTNEASLLEEFKKEFPDAVEKETEKFREYITGRNYPNERPPKPTYNIRAVNKETTRVFRVEVKQFDTRYGHVFIDNGNAYVYFPEGTSRIDSLNPKDRQSIYHTSRLTPGTSANERGDVGFSLGYTADTKRYNVYFHEPFVFFFDKKDMSEYEYSVNFLNKNQGVPLGTMGWLNFDNPQRAIDLYNQKTSNPKETAEFVIKSFDIPSGVFKAIYEHAIPEAQRSSDKSRPINVDLKASNQFGLQTTHIALINKFSIPGTGYVYQNLQEFEEMYRNWNQLGKVVTPTTTTSTTPRSPRSNRKG